MTKAHRASRADEMDASDEAREALETLDSLDTQQYDLRRLHEDLQHDVDSLAELWRLVGGITPDQDAKLQTLKQLLSKDLKGQKVIVFTYYRDTARYLYRELGGDRGEDFRKQAGEPSIRRMDGGASPAERSRLIQAFAPQSNNRPDLVGSDSEVDILIYGCPVRRPEPPGLRRPGQLRPALEPHSHGAEGWAHRPNRVESIRCCGCTTCSRRRGWNGSWAWWKASAARLRTSTGRVPRCIGARRNGPPQEFQHPAQHHGRGRLRD